MKTLEDVMKIYNIWRSASKNDSDELYGVSAFGFKLETFGMVDPAEPYNREIFENLRSQEEVALSRHQWKDYWHLTYFTENCDWWHGNVFDQMYADHLTKEAADVADLLAKQANPDREERLYNISTEVVDITPRFVEICLFDGHTHPNTYRLMRTVEVIAGVLSMSYKQRFPIIKPLPRRRPSFDYPDIDPVIRVPSHPSWPAGHAAQAVSIAFALMYVTAPKSRVRQKALLDVAFDIGENRVWAGVHYKHDILAGEILGAYLTAAWLKNILFDDPNGQLAKLFKAAKREWAKR